MASPSSTPAEISASVPTTKYEYIIDPTVTPASRVDKEIREQKHCKKIDEYEQHFCFFDNSNLTLYHQSVLRADGRQLVLLKWRSSLRSAIVGVCHRVQHEKWTHESSKRKKMELEPADVTLYLQGKYMPHKASAPDESSPKAVKLHDVIEQLRLAPVLHVVCTRTVYGITVPDGTTISVHFDHDIRAYRETNVWEDLVASDGQPYGPAKTYPFMIVKMRVPSDRKASALNLRTFLQDRLRARRAGISKFQYGCFTVLPELCQVMPRWYTFLHQDFLRDATAVPAPAGLGNPAINIGPIAAPTMLAMMSSACLLNKPIDPNQSQPPMPASTNAGSLFEMLKPRVRRTKKDKGVDPKAFLCNERTCFQWLNFMTVYSMFAIALSYKGGLGTNAKILTLTVICDIIIIYAVIMYHRRRIHFVNTNEARGFKTERRWNEKFGVTVASVVVSSGITAYLALLVATDGAA